MWNLWTVENIWCVLRVKPPISNYSEVEWTRPYMHFNSPRKPPRTARGNIIRERSGCHNSQQGITPLALYISDRVIKKPHWGIKFEQKRPFKRSLIRVKTNKQFSCTPTQCFSVEPWIFALREKENNKNHFPIFRNTNSQEGPSETLMAPWKKSTTAHRRDW